MPEAVFLFSVLEKKLPGRLPGEGHGGGEPLGGECGAGGAALRPIVIAAPARLGQAAALRLARFALVFCAALFGLYGIVAMCAALVWYLCTLESFGVPYLSPLCDGGAREILRALLRPRPDRVKLREAALRTPDRRCQR